MAIIAKASAAAPADLTISEVQLFTDSLNKSKPCLLPLPGSGVLDGQPFDLIATGYVESVKGMSVAVRLLAGRSATDTSEDVILGVSGNADCPAGERVPWSIKAHLLYIIETGTITGEVSSNTAGMYSGPVALIAPVAGIPTGTDPVLAFAVGVQVTPAAAPPAEETEEPPTEEVVPEQGDAAAPKDAAPETYIPPPPVGGSPVPLPAVSKELVTMVLFAISE